MSTASSAESGDETDFPARLLAAVQPLLELAVRVIPDADGVGLTLLDDGAAETILATAPFVEHADELQLRTGEGPVLTALTGTDARSGSLKNSEYPQVGPRLAELGLHGVLALPLRIDDQVRGCLTAYSRTEGAFATLAVAEDEILQLITATAAAILIDWDTQSEADLAAEYPTAPETAAAVAESLAKEQVQVSFEDAPIGIAITSLRGPVPGEVLRVNQAMCDLLGYTEDELVGGPAYHLTHSDDRPASQVIWRKLTSGELTHAEMDKRYCHKQGHEVWAHVTISAITGPDGSPAQAISHVVDVSQRKLDDDRLQRRFNQLTSAIDVGFALRQLDPPEVLFINPAYYTIFGFDPVGPAPAAGDLMTRIHPDDRVRARAMFDGISAGRRGVGDIRVVRPADGSQRWVRFSLDPVLDAAGVPHQVVGVFEDITEHKESELALRTSEQRFSNLVDNLDVGVFLRQIGEPTYLYHNASYASIFGLSAAQGRFINSEMLLGLTHPDDRARLDELYWEATQKGLSATSEHRIIRPDGVERWIRLTSSPVPDPSGAVTQIAGSVEDITDRKRAEAAMRSAQVEAELANAAKDEYLSRMSHELRTPLNAVLGFAQLLELESLTDSQSEAVDHILRGGRHLLEMINDVLDITAMEANRLAISAEPVDLDDLLTETIELTRNAAQRHGVSIHRYADRALPLVLADRWRLRQVLLNLLSNAVKYNRIGGHVRIAWAVAADGHGLRLSIQDTGIGIAAADLPRLYLPFDRLGQQASEVDGTGIGLALSQRLARLMGARLDVESEPGRGTTFFLTVPLAEVDAIETSGAGDLTADADIDEPVAAPERTLLYIEDNPLNVQLMSGIVKRRPNWTMVHAANGTQGLELAATIGPSIVLLDVHLPDLDGLEVLLRLRAAEPTAELPVAVVSADASPQQVQRLLAAGAQHYLTKPLVITDILTLLDES